MPAQHQDVTPLAVTNYRNNRQIFGIKADDRRRHFYVVGKTGSGKSTLLENMAIADVQAGHGLAIVDPHGEFAEKILDYVPEERIKDVIYFDPSDQEFPIAFNVFEQVPPEKQHLVASGLLGVFKKLWADSWGPRLEYILRNAIVSLLWYPEATLLDVMRILIDKEYRKVILPYIKDPVLTSFWVEEFSQYNQQFQSEAVAPIQNKVGQFLTAPLMRNIVGQKKSAFDARQIMDERKILILNLSKGRVGEDNSALLGAMMITKIQLAAMSRIEMAESSRPDFFLYVDEFQNFATDSFANILSEARKYRLSLILAHQYIEQLTDRKTGAHIVRDAVFGNVGSIVCFRVGAEDAEFLEKEFEPTIMGTDLVNLAKYNIYIKLMIDGVASQPFSAETLPNYPKPEVSFRQQIIEHTRLHYATPRARVAADISRLYGHYVEESGTPAGPAARPGSASLRPQASPPPTKILNLNPKLNPMINNLPSQPTHPPAEGAMASKFFATCWKCGQTVKVPFAPDGKRPVFCKDCFKKAQQLKESGVLPTIAAYISYDGANPPAASGAPVKGFAALKDILGERPAGPATPPKITHHVTTAPQRLEVPEQTKVQQEAKRDELRDLLSQTLKESGRDVAALAQSAVAEKKPEPEAEESRDVKESGAPYRTSTPSRGPATHKKTEGHSKKSESKDAKPKGTKVKKSQILKPGDVIRPH